MDIDADSLPDFITPESVALALEEEEAKGAKNTARPASVLTRLW